jgi:hypothetical protein
VTSFRAIWYTGETITRTACQLTGTAYRARLTSSDEFPNGARYLYGVEQLMLSSRAMGDTGYCGDPDTLITRHNLAYWRSEAGDRLGAVAALQELVDDMERVLGPPTTRDIEQPSRAREQARCGGKSS